MTIEELLKAAEGLLEEASIIAQNEVAELKERVVSLEKTLRYIEKIAQNESTHPMDRVVHIYATAQIALA